MSFRSNVRKPLLGTTIEPEMESAVTTISHRDRYDNVCPLLLDIFVLS